jgi:hypothetical protein
MLNFNQFNKKKEKKEYEIVKSRSNLPMFVIPLPDSVDITKDDKVPSIVDRVVNYISDRFPNNKTKKENK